MKLVEFWSKMNFEIVKYDMVWDKGENLFIWYFDMDYEMIFGEFV